MGASGTTLVNFGSGKYDTTVDVTGQTGIQSGSLTGAWVAPAVTANNGVDEHWVEQLEIYAGPPTAGVGFTIYAKCKEGLAYGLFNIGWAWT